MAYKQGLGYQVNRPAAAIALVGSPGTPYFTVTGGLVLVTALFGICTVAAGGANTLSFEFDPTLGAGATSAMTNTADIGTTGVEGDVVVMVGAPATAILGGHVEVNIVGSTMGRGCLCFNGNIGLVATAALGTYRWILFYIPIDTGAKIVAV